MFDPTTISKAIAGGLVGAVVALGARYGWHPDGQTVTALGIIVTSLIGYIIGHISVFVAPNNKK